MHDFDIYRQNRDREFAKFVCISCKIRKNGACMQFNKNTRMLISRIFVEKALSISGRLFILIGMPKRRFEKIHKEGGGNISDHLPDFLLCFDFTSERFGPRLTLLFHSFVDTVALSSVREEQLAVLFQKAGALKIWISSKIEPIAVSWNKLFLAADIGFQFFRFGGSFFVDEEKKVAVVLDVARCKSCPSSDTAKRDASKKLISEDMQAKQIVGHLCALMFQAPCKSSKLHHQKNTPSKLHHQKLRSRGKGVLPLLLLFSNTQRDRERDKRDSGSMAKSIWNR